MNEIGNSVATNGKLTYFDPTPSWGLERVLLLHSCALGFRVFSGYFSGSLDREQKTKPKVFLHKVFPNPGRPDPNPGHPGHSLSKTTEI